MTKSNGRGFIDPEEIGWRRHWRGMPEYVNEDMAPWGSVTVHFADPEDMREFEKLVNQKIGKKARYGKSIWFPEAQIGRLANKRYVDAPDA